MEVVVKANRLIKLFEAVLLIGILLVLCITLLGAFVDIVYVIHAKIMAPPVFIINAEGLMDLFSLILILLIGLELIETVKTYLKDDAVHVELIVLVAIIAIARKVVVWDFSKYDHTYLYSLAAMVLALGVTYFLVKRAGLKIPLRPHRLRGDEESRGI
jgi:uncharacterized membrane protein (DUF373 family)